MRHRLMTFGGGRSPPSRILSFWATRRKLYLYVSVRCGCFLGCVLHPVCKSSLRGRLGYVI